MTAALALTSPLPMIDEYVTWCRRRGLRPSYVREIRHTLTRVEAVVGPLKDATDTELEAWYDTLEVGAGARNAYLAHLAGFYRHLRRLRVRQDDPTERLVRPRTPKGLPRPIDTRRLQRALSTAPWPTNAFLALACYMGFRACEVATLHGEDLRGDTVIVRDGKGGKQRIVPMHDAVAKLLVGAPLAGPVFVTSQGGPFSANAVSNRANRFLHAQGITETFHQCRHWFGTNVYAASHDLRLTQELMGHSSPLTTSGYAAWNSAAAAEVIGKLSIPL